MFCLQMICLQGKLPTLFCFMLTTTWWIQFNLVIGSQWQESIGLLPSVWIHGSEMSNLSTIPTLMSSTFARFIHNDWGILRREVLLFSIQAYSYSSLLWFNLHISIVLVALTTDLFICLTGRKPISHLRELHSLWNLAENQTSMSVWHEPLLLPSMNMRT